MADTGVFRSKVRQKRLAIQKAIHQASKDESSYMKAAVAMPDLLQTSLPKREEWKIETIAEVLTEVPEHVKKELKKKRKRLKKVPVSFEMQDISHVDEICKDTENILDVSPHHNDSHQLIPKIPIQKHGFDNAGMYHTSSEKSFDSFDMGSYSTSEKQYQHHKEGCAQSVEGALSPSRVKRREKARSHAHELLKETVIDIPSSLQVDTQTKVITKPKPLPRKKKEKPLEQIDTDDNNQKILVTEKEAYNFFASELYEGQPSFKASYSSTLDTTNSTSEVPEVVESEEMTQDTAVLLKQDFYDKESEFYILCQKKPQYLSLKERLNKENEVLYNPSSKPVPIELKVPEGIEPRLHLEGFNVERRPNISEKNINTLENRLLKKQELHWFGKDGCIKMHPNTVYGLAYPVLEENIETSETVYVKASIDPCNQRLNKEKPYQLDLEISSVAFTHHPLFSKEHVLASRLIQMCKKYIAYDSVDSTSFRQKLKELRKVVGELKESVKMDESKACHLEACKKEIWQLTKLNDMQEAEHFDLLKKITSAWEELKSLRESQDYSNTSFRLEMTSEIPNEEEEKQEWEKRLKAEVESEKAAFELKYDSSVLEYNTLLSRWKDIHRAQKHAMKRQKRRETLAKKSNLSREEQSNVAELEATEDEDKYILSQPEMPKPQMPLKFDSKATFERLSQNAIKTRRKPGDAKTSISMEFDNPITPTEKCPKLEIQRRCNVSKTKLYFKIMYNEKKVSETSYRTLGQDFYAFWGQIFKLRIIHFPLNFRIEIFECGTSNKVKLAEIFLPIPECTQTSLNSLLEEHHFSTDQILSFKHSGVGSGVLFKFENDQQSWLLTSGNVKCSLLWGVAEDNTVLAPPKRQQNISLLSEAKNSTPLGVLLSSRISCFAELREWIKNNKLDPTDPSNVDLLQAVQEYRSDLNEQNAGENSNYFRLESLQGPLDFVTTEEMENNRFRLLELRDQDILEFRNLQMIPTDENLIPSEILELLQKKTIDDQKNEDEVQRDLAQQIRQKVREDVAKRFYLSQHQRTLEDIVIEESVPNIGTLGFGLLKLFQRKRPLYPVRKERKKVTGQSVGNTEVKIIVTILRAMNIPLRIDVDPVKDRMKRHSSISIESDFDSQVRPFVEVMFQRVAVKTNVAEGPHPTWNQELSLPFGVPNGDFSPSNLEKVNNNIYFNIFDEVAIDLLEDDKDRESVVHQRLERRWLGSLEIPFTTLYLNSKIEGTFRVNAPSVRLGYENEQCPWLLESSPSATTSHTYLSLFITIEPCLQLPEIFREKWDSGEPERVLREVGSWEQNVVSHFPERLIKAMAVDLSGKWIFVSRFLTPVSPPQELLQSGKDTLETWELLARFVALIPTVSDSAVYPGLCDIWSTSDQFLQMLMGDEEEHAILLCNFFLHIGKEAMLLLGSGIPEGPTAYVLTFEQNDDIWVWNATHGEHFSIQDSYSPLHRVGCLVSKDNVWANIQKNDHPSRINFDLSKTSDWKPFFSRSFPNPGLKTVQPFSLVYTPTDPEFVQTLQDKLKLSLQENIMKWRKRHCTSWNSYCNQVLYKILTRLERNAGRTASFDSLQELEQILSSHKMNGFPLSMPFTDTDSVIEAVFATGVHLTEDKNAEFSLAVYIHPYPCSVLAVWIYVAVLVSRRESE